MCGIFGVIKPGRNNRITREDIGTLKSLIALNYSRGRESLGLCALEGDKPALVKREGSPLKLAVEKDFTTLMDWAVGRCWAIFGHTRAATRGRVCARNAHPFEYGRIVGAHNGHVTAPASYEVDSEYLIDLLDKHKGDPRGLESVQGYWGLVWWDGYRRRIGLCAHNNELNLVAEDNLAVFSSSEEHLHFATGKEPAPFYEGEVVFLGQNGEVETTEINPVKYEPQARVRSITSGSGGWSLQGWEKEDKDLWAKDYDEEFVKEWEKYCQDWR